MARSGYKSNKHQKEMARKEKRELKKQRKLDRSTTGPEENTVPRIEDESV